MATLSVASKKKPGRGQVKERRSAHFRVSRSHHGRRGRRDFLLVLVASGDDDLVGQKGVPVGQVEHGLMGQLFCVVGRDRP